MGRWRGRWQTGVMAALLVAANWAPAADQLPLPATEEGTGVGQPPPPPGWLSTGRLGLFTTNITTANADTSRDPEVRSSASSASIIGTFDGTLWWRSESSSEVEQRFQARYGRSRSGDQGWVETADLLEYDGVYRMRYQPRNALYSALTATSAATGPDPRNSWFDPVQASLAAGHSWLQDGLLPLSDRLELRLGVRAQKRWGTGLTDFQREVEIGPEAWGRYERQQTAELSYWVQTNLFNEFDDLRHVEGLLTAGLTLRLTRIINIDLRLRSYYEHRPSDLPAGGNYQGYDELGLRQETLIGLVVNW